MKAYGEWSEGIALLLTSALVDSFTPRPLYPRGKGPGYPLCRRLGEAQSRSGWCGEEKNLVPLSGI
jgi:hypothetical protein